MEQHLARVNVKSTSGKVIGYFSLCPAHRGTDGRLYVSLRLVVHPTVRDPYPILSSHPLPTIELNDPESYDGFVRLAPNVR